jgi:hypothetical protein
MREEAISLSAPPRAALFREGRKKSKKNEKSSREKSQPSCSTLEALRSFFFTSNIGKGSASSFRAPFLLLPVLSFS